MQSENKTQIHIQWYPGHMTKAKREMQEKLKMVDMVIELRDARIPMASRNPLIDELCAHKPRLIILSKKDKAENEQTKKWVDHLSDDQTSVLALDVIHENITAKVVAAAQVVMKEKIERQKRRGIRPRAIRAMVVGVPNVGKSTFINKIVKRKIAQTGDRPGVTKALQWTKINDQLELLDTPGVLWPKFEDPQVGLLLGACGSIKDDILPIEEVCAWMIERLSRTHKQELEDRYGIEVCDDPYEVLQRIAIAKGFLMGNKKIDEKRTITTFLKDVRGDKLGRITWEEI